MFFCSTQYKLKDKQQATPDDSTYPQLHHDRENCPAKQEYSQASTCSEWEHSLPASKQNTD